MWFYRRLYKGLRAFIKQYVDPNNRKLYAKIGTHSIVGINSHIVPQNMYVDDYCVIQDQVNFISYTGKLYVKKFSVISSGVAIIPASHRLTVGVPFFLSTLGHINDEEGDIFIDEDCWIGAGAILLPKCHIGRGSVVGAGSVVKKSIPPYAVVVGSPARIIATKFSIEQILRHETILYPPEERFTKEELERLFADNYKDMHTIGVDDLNEEEYNKLVDLRMNLGMNNYNEF